MKLVQILTKDHCPNCEKLRKFLEFGLDNEYEEQIEFVHQGKNPERYHELKKRFDVQSIPVIIVGDEILRDPSPSHVHSFLQKRVG